MEPALLPTLAAAAAMFQARGLGFVLIGGLAVSLRGQPRMTVAVAVVIVADVDRAIELAGELTEAPFKPLFPGFEEVVARSYILPLRHRHTGIRLDVAIGMSGFERQAVGRAVPMTIGEVGVPVVVIEDLLVMKTLAGRLQNEQDLRGLVAAQQGFDRMARLPRLNAEARGRGGCRCPRPPRGRTPMISDGSNA